MKTIIKYFPELTDTQKEQFEKLGNLYIEWNQKINVISRKDIQNLYTHHILHALSIAKIISFKPGTKILDVGTGGGLPGIPLAIMFPKASFLLIDSAKKKITVTTDIIEKLQLPNVSAKQIHSTELKEKFDFITGRAVTAMPKFYESVRNCLSNTDKNAIPNGIFYLKGGDFNDEIKPFKKIAILHNIYDFFKEGYFKTKKIVYLPS